MEERLQTLEDVLSYNEKNGVEGLPSPIKTAATDRANAARIEEENR